MPPETLKDYASRIKFSNHKLSNGLSVIIYTDKRHPIANLTIGYDVGSKDEKPGKKGIAHLFEHLMFQGSENVKKNEHFQHVNNAGGTCNAFTMKDLTAYYEQMPSHRFETALWLESDRMNSLALSEENLQNQKNVVLEEKMQRYDNAPYGAAMHTIFEKLLKDSIYESPVIGYDDDIKSFKLDEAFNFHNTFYSPSNSVLVAGGDIEEDNALKQIERYFGGIAKPNGITRNDFKIPDFKEGLDIVIEDNINLEALYIAYRIPKSGTEEEYSLEYLANILANDKSSRLYKKLVYEKKILKSISAYKYTLKESGIFIIKGEVAAEKSSREAVEMILAELNDLGKNGVNRYEYMKVQNQIHFYNEVKHISLQKITLELMFDWLLFRDPDLINRKTGYYLAVTPEKIVKDVNKYFIDKPKLVMTFVPKRKK